MCEQKHWVVNEKGLLARVGLQDVQARFASLPRTAAELTRWVDELRGALSLALAGGRRDNVRAPSHSHGGVPARRDCRAGLCAHPKSGQVRVAALA